jgi:hypothetical protein
MPSPKVLLFPFFFLLCSCLLPFSHFLPLPPFFSSGPFLFFLSGAVNLFYIVTAVAIPIVAGLCNSSLLGASLSVASSFGVFEIVSVCVVVVGIVVYRSSGDE